MSIFLDFLLAGIITGALYALISVGLTLIYSVMRVVNVAHGDLVTLGAYVLVVALGAFSVQGPVGAVVYLLVAIAIGALAGVLIQILLVAPVLASRQESEQRLLVLTLGLSLLLSNGFQVVFGPNVHEVPFLVPGATRIGSIAISNQRLGLVIVSAVLVVALIGFLRLTRRGLSIRATADNLEAAQSCGINTRQAFVVTFAIGAALAAGVGAFVAPITAVYPPMGFAFTIKAFIVVIVGGLGSLPGALVASFLLGISESLAVMWLPSGVANTISPLVMLLVLLLRPNGLLGRRVGRL